MEDEGRREISRGANAQVIAKWDQEQARLREFMGQAHHIIVTVVDVPVGDGEYAIKVAYTVRGLPPAPSEAKAAMSELFEQIRAALSDEIERMDDSFDEDLA